MRLTVMDAETIPADLTSPGSRADVPGASVTVSDFDSPQVDAAVNGSRLLECRELCSRQLGRSAACSHAPAQGFRKIAPIAQRPCERRSQRVARTDGRNRFDSRRRGFPQTFGAFKVHGANGATAAKRKNDGLRPH